MKDIKTQSEPVEMKTITSKLKKTPDGIPRKLEIGIGKHEDVTIETTKMTQRNKERI